MKKSVIISLAITVMILLSNCDSLFSQTYNVIKACYVSMTVPDPSGGRWIWDQTISIGDTISAPLGGMIDNYDVPWCASFGCCDSLSYNGMSISLHTIKADTCYRIFITGGLSGGPYFTDGFVEIPFGWKVDSIVDSSNNPGTGAYDTIVNNKIIFHAGTDYGGCVCSDCGRAKLNYFISPYIDAIPVISGKKDTYYIYPNPASNKITIESKNKLPEKTIISIININGEQVIYDQFKNPNQIELNVKTLTKGIYFVKIQTERGINMKKLVIQ